MTRDCCLGIALFVASGLLGCGGPELRLGGQPSGRLPDAGTHDFGLAGAPSSPRAGKGVAGVGAGPISRGTAVAGSPGPANRGANSGSSAGIGGTGGSPNFGTGGAIGFMPGTGAVPGMAGAAAKCDGSGTCYFPDGSVCYPSGSCCYPSGVCTMPVAAGPWVAPVAAKDLGTPGWKSSKDPLCSKNSGGYLYSFSIWSDGRGVFAAPVTEKSSGPVDMACPGCPSETIYLNDGSGWTLVAGTPFSGQQLLRGFDHGPLVLYGYGYGPMTSPSMGSSCGLALLENGVRTCEPTDGVTDIAVARRDLAYGVLQGDVIRYDGSRWGPLPVAFPGQHELTYLWADASVVMALGGSPGKIYSLHDATWKVEDTRTLENFSAIWGFSATDVWAGTSQGSLYHYDGSAWNKVVWSGTGCANDPSIHGMWGANGVLYFYGMTSLARWDGSQVQTLAQWACDQAQGSAFISSLWGNSPTEVFVAITDQRQPVQACGSAFVLNFDGTQFHRM